MVRANPYQLLGSKKELLTRIEDFDWLVRGLAFGEHSGRKVSKKPGTGLEFSQYRLYSQGDDLRMLDWKMYARTEKLYIKQSEIDTNISVTFVPDQSASMQYSEDGWSKQQQSKLLMAVLAFLSSRNGDKYGVAGVHNDDPGILPHRGKKHWDRFLNHLVSLRESKKFSEPTILRLREKELFVVISDLYDEAGEWTSFIKKLKTRRSEVIVFHLMGENELELNFTNTTLFRDLESGTELKVDPGTFKENYQRNLSDWIRSLKEDFRNKGIDYNLVKMNAPLDDLITRFVWHRKKLM